MTIEAFWNAGSGNFFSGGSWNEPNPNAPPPFLHYVPGANEDAYLVDNLGAAFTVAYNGTRTLNTLRADANATLNMTGGTLTLLQGGAPFLGKIDLASAATLKIDGGTFNLSNLSVSGTVSGDGTLRCINGIFDINAGADLTVETWLLTYQIGSGTVSTTNINTNLTYANDFQLLDVFGNYPILNLNNRTLTLSGTALLDGVINGPGTLRITGTGTLAGGTLENGTIRVSGSTTQSGVFGLGGTLQIDAGATHTFTGGTSINTTLSGAGTIVNSGTLTDSAPGLSRISGNLTNNGTLSIAAGAELVLDSGTQNLKGTITGAGQLTLGFAHQTTLNSASITVGSLLVAGGNGGGTVTLGRNTTYGGSFTLADTGTFDLNGFTFTLGGTTVMSNGYVDGPGTMRITGSATIGGISFGDVAGGDPGTAATLRNSGTVTQTGFVYLKGTILNDAARTYNLVASNIENNGDSSVLNNGTFNVSRTVSATDSTIWSALTNNGTINVASGASLRIAGTGNDLGGASKGAGRLIVAGTTSIDGTITTGELVFAGGTTLAKDLSYNGIFSIGTFSTTDLDGHVLTLRGTANLTSGFNSIGGGGVLMLMGTTALAGVGFGPTGGAVTIVNNGVVNQTGSINVNGALTNSLGKTYNLVASAISSDTNGTNTGLVFTNNGKLNVKTSASLGESSIAGSLFSDGTISIAAGATLRLSGTSTLEGTISGGGGLLLAGNAFVDTAIGTKSLAFLGTTTLGTDLTYGGAFSIGTFSTTNLGNKTLTLAGTAHLDTGFNSIRSGTLAVTGSATIGGVSLGNGAGGKVTLRNSGEIDLIGGISLEGTIVNNAGATIAMSAASNITNLGPGGGTITNSGVFSKDGDAGTGTISALFQNRGTVIVEQGTLDFQNFQHIGIIQGVVTQSGNRFIVTADAAGETTLTGGSGANRFVLDKAPTHVDGGTGTDTIAVQKSMTFAADSVTNVERFEIVNGISVNLSALDEGASITVASIAGGGSTVRSSGGVDVITGGLGNDTYYVNNAGDQVRETAAGGTDTIVTSVSYTLGAGQAIEILRTSNVDGLPALNLTGNERAQTIEGNAGANVIDGRGGADIMKGGKGDDTYVVDNAGDQVVELASAGIDTVKASISHTLGANVENLTLTGSAAINGTGNTLANTITGNAAANRLDGKAGSDTLKGLGGADVFVFANALGASNVDHIVDFAPSADKIELSSAIFGALSPGSLDATAFKNIATGTVDTDDRILYDSATGALYYDANGSGAGQRVQFAVLDNHASLNSTHFLIV